MKKKSEQPGELTVLELQTGKIEFCILGLSPFVFNAMSAKAKGDLLLPKPKMSDADKASRLKHDPLMEFRESVYSHRNDDAATRLKFPSVAFKKGIAAAAIDIPGLKKAQIGRLVWPDWQDVDIYGVPEMFMAVVRMADIGRTPDVRTRAILPTWATKVTLNFVKPLINHKSLANLLAAAGRVIGVGDGRQEKGTHSFGQFELVEATDARFKAIIKSGRVAQDAALARPKFYDIETEKLFAWFMEEVGKRGKGEMVTGKDHRVKARVKPSANGNGAGRESHAH